LTAFQTATTTSDSSTYHVMATSGLKMRATPNGKKLLTIPYNGEVEKINDGKSYGDLIVTELKDFKIKGEWVKVRYDGQEGFVFSGFLTQFPIPNGNDYLKDVLKVSKEKYDVKNYNNCDPKTSKECECGWSKSYYDNQVHHTYSYCSEEMVEDYITFENINFAEVYFIYKAMGDISDLKYDKASKTIKGEKEGEEAGFYTVTIKAIGENKYQIYTTSSC
jgi:hypothetical protein